MKRTNASHERYEKRMIQETNARYTNERNETNERTIHETNKRTIHERTNHWSVTIYYPMTNDPGSIELTHLIFYTQLIYINDKLVGKVIV